jgi:HopA1 effector protein family
VTRYRDQVTSALEAVTIRSETQYAWLGRASRALPSSLLAEMDASQRRNYLVTCVREELYSSFYCHGHPVPARWGEREPASADLRIAKAMSQANRGRGSWEPGWTVQRLDGTDALVTTPRLRVRVGLTDCHTFDGPMRPGSVISLRLPNELPSLSPGFYTAVSDAVTDLAGPDELVRVYWNVTRAGASTLVGALTSRLNADGAPFRLKVADHPHRLDRCDAAVLYLPANSLPALRETLREMAAGLTACLCPEIPAFTLELAPGVGLAEDRRGAESFGARRCQLLADGIVRSHEQGIPAIDAVAGRFAEAGVAIDAPYLEPSLEGRHVL